MKQTDWKRLSKEERTQAAIRILEERAARGDSNARFVLASLRKRKK